MLTFQTEKLWLIASGVQQLFGAILDQARWRLRCLRQGLLLLTACQVGELRRPDMPLD